MSNAETIANIAQKNSRNALQRIEMLERGQQQIASGVNNALNQLQGQFNQYGALVDAITDILGTEVVTQKVVEIQKARALADVESNKAQVAQLLTEGVLVKAEKVSEKSLIVGRELSKDTEEKPGEVIFPGRQQVTFAQVRPDLKEKMLGAAVGTNIETPGGNVFEVMEIYDIIEKKAEETPAAAPAASATAPEAAPVAAAATEPQGS